MRTFDGGLAGGRSGGCDGGGCTAIKQEAIDQWFFL